MKPRNQCVSISFFATDEEADALRRKVDVLAARRGFVNESGSHRIGTPSRSKLLMTLAEEAFARSPDAGLSAGELDAIVAEFTAGQQRARTPEAVAAAVAAAGGNKSDAARSLGISRNLVYSLLRKRKK